jgi:N-acetylglutamate synthase-like GNAT family acetyltransferase
MPAARLAIESDWPTVSDLLSVSGLPLAGAHEHIASFLLIEVERQLAGCIAVERYGEDGKFGLLRSCAVDKNYRNQGLGIALTDAAITHARQTGVKQMVLLTTTAENFFPRFGFAVITREEVPPPLKASAEFQGACPASAIIMRKSFEG